LALACLLPSCHGHLAAGYLELDLHSNDELTDFLRWVRSLNPVVVTIVDREATTIDDDGLPRMVVTAMDPIPSRPPPHRLHRDLGIVMPWHDPVNCNEAHTLY
jgi:hypothetical protein